LTQRFKGRVLQSSLHLVDLGGSEQVKKSKAAGQRFTEAVEINSSLMVLGRVVDALARKQDHVPFYESKLTLLLQPVLKGNARTTVLIAASPEQANGDETSHALRFGERCSQLAGGGQAGSATMAEVLASLQANIESCKTEVADLEARGAKEKALAELGDKELRGLGFGHGRSRLVARDHDDGTNGQEAAVGPEAKEAPQRGVYTEVEDLAGKWLTTQERLKALERRRREIMGA